MTMMRIEWKITYGNMESKKDPGQEKKKARKGEVREETRNSNGEGEDNDMEPRRTKKLTPMEKSALSPLVGVGRREWTDISKR